jgi:L-asparaginase II
MQTPPVLARILRGGRVESVHRGSAAAVGSDGRLVAAAGSPSSLVYVRSAAKPFQAMPLLEGGGERAFGLTSSDIALMCSSHGGEPRHVEAARRLLQKGGFRERDLACGAHWPMHERSARSLRGRGQRPTALHNNCSGKHAGLLLACRLYGFASRGYWRPTHPIHQEVLRRLALWAGVPAARIEIAVDGCSLPVFRLPLSSLALAYGKLVSPEAGEVAARILKAMWERPAMMAGARRFTTAFIAAGTGRWLGKEGAEGVYAIGLAPGVARVKAVGLAFKIEDGSTRARDAVSIALLERLGALSPRAGRALSAWRRPALRNARGLLVGSIEADASALGPAR